MHTTYIIDKDNLPNSVLNNYKLKKSKYLLQPNAKTRTDLHKTQQVKYKTKLRNMKPE